LEQAYVDGMDIVNLSIGGSSEWPESPEARAAGNLVLKGVVVTAAQGNTACWIWCTRVHNICIFQLGNDGSDGLWSTSSPGVNPLVIACGGAESSRYPGGIASFRDNSTGAALSILYATNIEFSARIPQGLKTVVLDIDFCDMPMVPPTLNNTVVLIPRGGCVIVAKAKNAKALGAVAILVYNYRPGLFKFVVTESEVPLPVAGISMEDARRIKDMVQGGHDIVVSWSEGIQMFDNPTKGQLAEFSSVSDFKVKY
jgi:hypothetical protein